ASTGIFLCTKHRLCSACRCIAVLSDAATPERKCRTTLEGTSCYLAEHFGSSRVKREFYTCRNCSAARTFYPRNNHQRTDPQCPISNFMKKSRKNFPSASPRVSSSQENCCRVKVTYARNSGHRAVRCVKLSRLCAPK